MTSAEYFAKKCGKVTISVTNNQYPLAPLFSPIYNTTRPYSQTRSNIQRDLIQPDEFARLDKHKCIVMFNHYKPAQLYKIALEELPAYGELSKCSVFDYVPEWKRREEENEKHAPEKKRAHAAGISACLCTAEWGTPPDAGGCAWRGAAPLIRPVLLRVADAGVWRVWRCAAAQITALPRQTPERRASMTFRTRKGPAPDDIGLVEMSRSEIAGDDAPELEELDDDPSRIPPGRGI